MFKKSIVAIISFAMVLPMFTSFSVSAENVVNDASVSGYISMTNENGGLELVSADKTPTIYVDDSDFEGVVRAVGDLKSDIKTVTGVTSTVTNNIKKEQLSGNVEGIEILDNSMRVILNEAVEENAQCYIAAYNRDGILAGLAKSDKRFNDEHIADGFEFNSTLERPNGGSMKAFIWKDTKPLTDSKTLQQASTTFILDDIDVVIGTIGESEVIDNLAKNGRLDISEIEGEWESFTIQNVDNTVVIAGSDKRGTIYGIYDLCEKIGVSPWSFWADTVTGHADSLYINLPDNGYTEGEPSVQYRGIFLNDEFNMSEWSKSMGNTGKNMNNATYEKIFELLLRLKANYLWPAMHTYSTAFNVTEKNAALADKYGIVMGSSHAEPLLRNNLGELYDYQEEWKSKAENSEKVLNTKTADGKTTIKDDANRTVAYMWTDKDNDGNAVSNKEFLTDYWRARAAANSGYENTYTLGMRGVHDGSFSTNMDSKTAMKEILETQKNILQDEVVKEGQSISDIPQVFIPYKEMLNMYNEGLEIPEYVTLMWPDDNFGYIRQLPTEEERKRSGGAGIYYHLSYYGRPTSYLWLSTTQPSLIREEMTKAYDMGAKKIWIANVGDLKPAETEIEYFLDLAHDINTVRNTDVSEWLAGNAKRDFGFNEEKASEYADIKLGYYKNAISRRPEHFVNGLFGAEYGDEGQKLIDSYTDLEQRAKKLYDALSADKQPSFYELMLYPLKGAKNMAEKYVYSDKAKLYAEKGYGAAVNKYSKLSDDAYQRVVDDTKEYTTMLNGKWDKMMNPYQTKLTGSFGGTITGKLTNPTVSQLPYTNMVIVPEGCDTMADEAGSVKMTFTKYSTEPKYIDIINTGTGSFDWTAETTADWLKINKTNGTVADDDRVYISVDAEKADVETLATGNCVGSIYFKQRIGNNEINLKTVTVSFSAVPGISTVEEKTYIENDGYVSIEAEHYTNNVKNGKYEWKVEKDFGRSGDSVKIYPDTAEAVAVPNKTNSAYLEYNVYFTSAGTFPIDLYRMPTLNEISGGTMRCNIGVDDNTPVRFSGTRAAKDKSDGTDAWGKGVLQNTEILSGNITVPSAGLHTIRLYNESPEFVVDKFVITTGEKKVSYFGAPESYNSTYNNEMKPLPTPSIASDEQTGDIIALFQPKTMISFVGEDKVSVIKLTDTNEDYTLVEAAYDKDGKMLNATYTDFNLNDVSVSDLKEITRNVVNSEGADEIQYMVLKDLGDCYEAVAMPYTSLLANENDISLSASYEDGYMYPSFDMTPYIGKEAVCMISDETGIKYIRQSTVNTAEYDEIPFADKGEFDLKIKVSGESNLLQETISTIINITPDNEATSSATIYNQPLSADPSSDEEVTLNGASYDSAKKAINMGTGGTMSIDLNKPVTMIQGDVITVTSKIAHAKNNGKYMDYAIKDSKGNSIAAIHVSAYNGTTTSHWISIGDEKVYENKGSLMQVIERTSAGTAGGYTTYTTVINVSTGVVEMTISSSKGTEKLTGKLPSKIADISTLFFTNDYTDAAKTCLVKDISITKSKDASYNMVFDVVDKSTSQTIENAVVTVTDAVTGSVITPIEGVYELCKGKYNYTVTADGYNSVSNTLDLSPSTTSKNITVKMEMN